MFKKILIIFVVLSISLFLLKLYREHYVVENFIEGTDTLDLEDKTSIKTKTFVDTKKIDPLRYNKKLDNMGKYTEYRNIKNPNDVLSYKVNYSIIPTKYLDKCGKNGKTYWNFTNYSEEYINSTSPNNCRNECSKKDSCDAYLLDQDSNCYLFELKKGNTATYNCNKPFNDGEWFGSIKASAKTSVEKKIFPGLNPGDIITLSNPITGTLLKMNTDRSLVGDSNGSVKDSRCKFLVLYIPYDGEKGAIALWNIGTKRFCGTYEERIVGAKDQSTPSDSFVSGTEVIKSIGNDGGTVTLVFPSTNKMISLNNQNKCVPVNFDKSASFDASSRNVFVPNVLVKNTGCYDLKSSVYLGTGNNINECLAIAVKNGQQSFGITNGNRCVALKSSPTKKIPYCSINNMGGSNRATNVYNISSIEYELLQNTIGSIHYHTNYHIQEGGYGMALGVCGRRGCGGGIGTYPMKGSGSSYYNNNKNKCMWRFVPKGEDENSKPKPKCDKHRLGNIGDNTNDTSEPVIHYEDVFTIRCIEDNRWLVSCDYFSCGSSSYLAVSANTYNGPSNVFAGNAQYWKFVSVDGKTGPVKFGDRFRLINLWGPTSALATCWHYNCGGIYYDGYSVNTVKINSSDYNNIVSHWFIGDTM